MFGSSSHALWLDSSNAETSPHPRNRFSIMADNQGALGLYAEHSRGTTTISSPHLQIRIRSPFFDWLAGVWDKALEPMNSVPFQFTPGWLGYIGYELKHETNGTKPGGSWGGPPEGVAGHRAPDAALIFADHAIVVDHVERCAHVMCLAASGEEQTARRRLAGTIELLRVLPTKRNLPKTIEANADGPQRNRQQLHFRALDSKQQYLDKITAAKAEITEGNSYEICLTTQLIAEPTEPIVAWDVYRLLRKQNPAPFAAYVTLGALKIASTSPERFLRIDMEGTMTAEPIKGTRARHRDPRIDAQLKDSLASSAKDRAENIMIVDLMRNDLSRSAEPASVVVERLCDIESYSTVHQMVSTIRARLRPGLQRAQAVARAFPAGSMTGAPKASTMSILESLEAGRRGAYSGAIGYFSLNGASDLSVLIRTLVIEGPNISEGTQRQRLSLGIGGAITADSDPFEEYEEIQIKARGVLASVDAHFPHDDPPELAPNS